MNFQTAGKIEGVIVSGRDQPVIGRGDGLNHATVRLKKSRPATGAAVKVSGDITVGRVIRR